MASVTLKQVCKTYDQKVQAVKDFSMEIQDGEFIVLVGPSGCGKSTTLRMVAGLEEITSGEILIGDQVVNKVPPKDRDIAMVFQNYALYPHMTVYDNIAYGLKLRKYPRRVIDEKVKEAAEILAITELLDRKPKALSGGQRQRVAIGRAIVRHPKVFLMDEPLSNLDAKLRNQMRAEIIKLRSQLKTTFIYVTHDQTEAMTLGDRIAVMKDGVTQQIGTPSELFYHPANQFVAGFIGTPVMNFISDVPLIAQDGKCYVRIFGQQLELPEEKQELLRQRSDWPGRVTVGVRPAHVLLSPTGIEAVVEVCEMMGTEATLHLRVGEHEMELQMVITDEMTQIPRMGETVHFQLQPATLHFFHSEDGTNLF